MKTQPIKTIDVLQITDTHLFADPSAVLKGVNTSATLERVLGVIERDHQQAACMLVTGDLSQDETAESYHRLRDRLSALGMPSYWLPGNHDRPDLLAAANPTALQTQLIFGNWQILLLNSRVAGEVFGYLDDAQLQLLTTALQQNPDKHTLLALHHHVAPVASAWMDGSLVQNADALARVLALHSNVRGIIHGHVHQAKEYTFANLPVMATPSTCVQFAPDSDEFLLDKQRPGFRILKLHDDGKIVSKVVRVGE